MRLGNLMSLFSSKWKKIYSGEPEMHSESRQYLIVADLEDTEDHE